MSQGCYARSLMDERVRLGAFYDGWLRDVMRNYSLVCMGWLLLSMFMMHRFMFHGFIEAL